MLLKRLGALFGAAVIGGATLVAGQTNYSAQAETRYQVINTSYSSHVIYVRNSSGSSWVTVGRGSYRMISVGGQVMVNGSSYRQSNNNGSFGSCVNIPGSKVKTVTHSIEAYRTYRNSYCKN